MYILQHTLLEKFLYLHIRSLNLHLLIRRGVMELISKQETFIVLYFNVNYSQVDACWNMIIRNLFTNLT